MSPSREFMVRQAVLNAALRLWPANVELFGVAPTIADMKMVWDMFDGKPTATFAHTVTAEYRALAARYAQ